MLRPRLVYLVIAILLSASSPLHAKEKVKVEVVESWTYLYWVSGTRFIPASPERKITRCEGTSGIYVPNYGSTCVTTTTPGTPEHSTPWPTAFGYFHSTSIIMPDGEHVIATCLSSENHCGTFVNESAGGVEKKCTDLSQGMVGTTKYLCGYTLSGAKSLGVFQAEIDGDKITIGSPNGKRVYEKSGTWGEVDTKLSGGSKAGVAGDRPEASTGIAKDHHEAASDISIPEKVFKDAASGDSDAQSYLGYAYSTGTGVPKDTALALSWTRKAADQGDPFAQSNLALFYSRGDGVPKDLIQAVSWWRKAADQNNPTAQCGLGVAYEFGIGVPQSFAEAYFWLSIGGAALAGPDQEKCLNGRDTVAAKLGASDLSALQKRAVQWSADHPVH